MDNRGSDLARSNAGPLKQVSNAGTNRFKGLSGRSQSLLHTHRTGETVQEDDVGEGAAYVDGETPIISGHSECLRSSRGGAKTSRIQHSPYSSSPTKTLSPCQTPLGAR